MPQFFNSSKKQENIQLQLLQNAAGEGSCHYQQQHTLFISLSSRPIRYLQTQGGKTHRGIYRQGDILITPVNTPLFVRWEDEEDCLQIQLNSQFIADIAQETLSPHPNRIELLPAFQIRDSQIQAIATMLLNEYRQENLSNRLYIDSLSNILAVNLLRHYTASKPQIALYEGGLPPKHLNKILDYIDAYLDRKIELANLAELLDMSTFHFCRLFKRSLGKTPHQYLSQQRVERAKKLLKQTDLLITDIALECGFNSHSHLTQKFRQLTGITPKNYRQM